MFTGIIRKTVKVGGVKKETGGLAVEVTAPAGWRVREGQSISVNGICSTAARVRGEKLTFQYMPETIRKTTVRWWKKGDIVNLEESLRLGDSLDGHIVMGHVEGIGRVTAFVNSKRERLFKIETTRQLVAHMIQKGSITLDGVSLTLVDVAEDWFAVALTRYTLAHTNWKKKKVGSLLNIETDILGRQHVQKVLGPYAKKAKHQK